MKYPKHTYDSHCPGCDERIKEACPEVASFFYLVKEAYPDVHTSCVHRGKEEQEIAFKGGYSRAHFPNSKHNSLPSKAVDLFQLDEKGEAHFNREMYAKIAALALMRGLPIRWGGTFKSIKDFPHFELMEKE